MNRNRGLFTYSRAVEKKVQCFVKSCVSNKGVPLIGNSEWFGVASQNMK